jgi:hypothetical protein
LSKTSWSWKESTASNFERCSAPEVMFDGVSTPLEGVPGTRGLLDVAAESRPMLSCHSPEKTPKPPE